MLDVQAAGICHSDLHILDGPGAAWLDKVPITLGHEVAGEISALGEGVQRFSVGDRVGVANISQLEDRRAAGFIRSGPGIEVDGGYAESIEVHESTLVRIPDGVSFASAALAADAIATSFHAVRAAGAGSGCTVGIIGVGGLGLNALRVAVLDAARVYAVDIDVTRFDAAIAAGATAFFESVSALKDVECDVIIDFVGTTATVTAALDAVGTKMGEVNWGGRVVVVGLAAETLEIPVSQLVHGHKELVGSLGASRDDLNQVYALLAEGELVPAVVEVSLEDLNDSLKKLARGEVGGHRLVVVPECSA